MKKSPVKRLKGVKRRKKILITIEVIFFLLLASALTIWFVPSLKTWAVKAIAQTELGVKIIEKLERPSYDDSILDTNFSESNIKVNDLTYNYSEEYTNFIMFGVDSREGEVDASNSDSMLIVSIHNTTGAVKMVSLYRDTYCGIYSRDGYINNYFKLNSAYAGGGPEAAITTINKNLDLDLKDYVTVNFAGVATIIDQLGGITVNLTEDELSQLNYHLKGTMNAAGMETELVPHSGENIELNGIQATTYCRIRKATFYDPDTGEAVSDDFGRTARQRSVMKKLIEKAKSADANQLTSMVSAVMNENTDRNRIISTSFTFEEICNMIPVLFEFYLEGTEGFPSEKTTTTINGASYVVPCGLAANVAELHRFLYDEEEYYPTGNVWELNNQIENYTGINEYTPSINTEDKTDTYDFEEHVDYGYDDGGDSEFNR